jgi:hypothetical protein
LEHMPQCCCCCHHSCWAALPQTQEQQHSRGCWQQACYMKPAAQSLRVHTCLQVSQIDTGADCWRGPWVMGTPQIDTGADCWRGPWVMRTPQIDTGADCWRGPWVMRTPQIDTGADCWRGPWVMRTPQNRLWVWRLPPVCGTQGLCGSTGAGRVQAASLQVVRRK